MGKKVSVCANTTYEAQKLAAAMLKVTEKNRHKIDVYLSETPQGAVTHTITN
jgi:hypothetical protein